MKHTAVLCILAMASSLAFAQANPQDHAAHHPDGAMKLMQSGCR